MSKWDLCPRRGVIAVCDSRRSVALCPDARHRTSNTRDWEEFLDDPAEFSLSMRNWMVACYGQTEVPPDKWLKQLP